MTRRRRFIVICFSFTLRRYSENMMTGRSTTTSRSTSTSTSSTGTNSYIFKPAYEATFATALT